MACLRQRGSPNLFFTMACAEYKWDKLIKEILQVKEKRLVDFSEIDKMSSSEKNKLLSDNAVISTVHFSKRVEKLFRLFKTCGTFDPYVLEDYYIRVEFQARGAPHVQCLLWLLEYDEQCDKWQPMDTMFTGKEDKANNVDRLTKMEKHAMNLISASMKDIKCIDCKESQKAPIYSLSDSDGRKPDLSDSDDCPNCEQIKKRVITFNNHNCGFSCHKKIKIK